MASNNESLDDALNSFGGSDLIPHSKLVDIAFRAWHTLPESDRASKQAVERWRSAIYVACKPSLDAAAASLQERNSDEPSLLGAKLTLLRDAFTRQVDRAMRDLSEGDRKKRDQAKAMAAVNAMIKGMNKG